MQDLRKIQKLRVASVFGEVTPNDLEKAGHGHIGEIRDWGGKKYKKQPNGKWLQVSESHGMTKKEHEDTADSHFQDGGHETQGVNYDAVERHNKISSNLSDKEHDESELDDKVSSERGKGENSKRMQLHKEAMDAGATEVEADEIANGKRNKNDHSGIEKTSHPYTKAIKLAEELGYIDLVKHLKTLHPGDKTIIARLRGLEQAKLERDERTSQIDSIFKDASSEDIRYAKHLLDSGKTVEEVVSYMKENMNKSMSSLSTPGFETVTDHGKIVDIKKSEDELITFLKTIPTIEEQEMLTKSHNGLTAKKVTVHRKDGTPYIAVRWVNEHGESPTIEHPKYKKESEYEGNDDSEKVSNIVNSNSKPIEKQRALIALGIRDKQTLDHLSGTHYNDSQHYLKNEAKIQDWKEYSINDMLPSSPSGDGVEISSPSILNSVVSDIQSKLGDKKAFELQQQLKEELIKKYNVTVEDKWDGYSENLTLLLDGELGLRSVMGYGTGGVGKTFAFEKLAQERGMNEYDAELDMEMGGDEYDYIKIGGKIGSKEMQRAMFYHRNKLLVFDDCDSMWDDEGLINVLKNTLDTSGKGKTQWAQRLPGQNGEEDVPSVFTFTGQMIFITNKTKKELVEAGAGPIVESRAASSDLSMNMVQTLERLEKILPGVTLKDTNREPMADVTEEDKQQALTALKSVAQYARVEQLNTRVITGLIAKARYQRKRKGGYNANDLSKIALQQFGIL